MNVLVLIPRFRSTQYAVVRNGKTEQKGTLSTEPGLSGTALAGMAAPDLIGLRIPYGGSQFSKSMRADRITLERLDALARESPLSIPHCAALARDCLAAWPDVALVLCFETAFFSALPRRESAYALDSGVMGRTGLRRYGFCGLFHAAAARQAIEKKKKALPRLISVCLEPKPEIAAVIGQRSVMVTSGSTPLEGLPGECTSGELDPAILLDLIEKKNWGPEHVNHLLTQHSGIQGLTGRKATLKDVLRNQGGDLQPIRDLILYRMKLACGAAVAAMSGADRIVFSGRYAAAGEVLGPELAGAFKGRIELPFSVLTDPIEKLVTEEAVAVIRRNYRGMPTAVPSP